MSKKNLRTPIILNAAFVFVSIAAYLWLSYRAGCIGDVKGGFLGDPSKALEMQGYAFLPLFLFICCTAGFVFLYLPSNFPARIAFSAIGFLFLFWTHIVVSAKVEEFGVDSCLIDHSANEHESLKQSEMSGDGKDVPIVEVLNLNQTGLPTPEKSNVIMTREECERTRQLDFSDANACFGLFHRRHEVLEVCATYRLDFNKKCGAPRGTMSPLGIAIVSNDEYEFIKILDNGAKSPFPYVTAELISNCNHAGTGKLTGSGIDPLTWCGRAAKALIMRGADVNDMFDMAIKDSFRGNGAFLEKLVELGAEVNHQDSHGCTALDKVQFGEYIPRNPWQSTYKPPSERIQFMERNKAKSASMCRFNRALTLAPIYLKVVVEKAVSMVLMIPIVLIAMLGTWSGH